MATWANLYEQYGDHSQQTYLYPKSHSGDYHHDYNHNDNFMDHMYSHQHDDHRHHHVDQFNHFSSIDSISPPQSPGEFQASFSRQQIKEHNRKVGWQQWITLKGNVYHTTGFRDHFIAYNKKKAAEKEKEKVRESGFEDCSMLSVSEAQQSGFEDCSMLSVSEAQQSGFEDCSMLSVSEAQQSSSHENQVLHCAFSSQVFDDSVNDKNNPKEREMTELADTDSCSETESETADDDDESDSEDDENFLWQYDVIAALRKSGLCMAEIEAEIGPFKIGTLENVHMPSWKYWQRIRTDVIALHDDMINNPSDDTNEYEQEYLALLQRWLRRYRDMDPVEKRPNGDGNTNVFFLTQDPDALREWVRTLPPLDTAVPESGAWKQTELQLSPLGNTHDVFVTSLRSHHSDDAHFCFDIEGDVAWYELPQNVISDDQMTENQQAVHAARAEHGNCAHDLERMKRRRQRLGQYFMKKYRYSKEKIAGFMRWADVMNENERELHAHCNADV